MLIKCKGCNSSYHKKDMQSTHKHGLANGETILIGLCKSCSKDFNWQGNTIETKDAAKRKKGYFKDRKGNWKKGQKFKD